MVDNVPFMNKILRKKTMKRSNKETNIYSSDGD